jgi:hypothetical protein
VINLTFSIHCARLFFLLTSIFVATYFFGIRQCNAQITLGSNRLEALASLRTGSLWIDSLYRDSRIYRYIADSINWSGHRSIVMVDIDTSDKVSRWTITAESIDSNKFLRSFREEILSARCQKQSRNKQVLYSIVVWPEYDKHIFYWPMESRLQLEYVPHGAGSKMPFRR